MSPRRPQRTPTAGLLALATMVAAGPVWAPRPASAQCSSAGNPAPPLPLQANYASQSFGNNPPLSPYSVGRTAESGCDGQPGSGGFSGVTGSPGQPAGTIGSVNTNLTVIGGFNGGVGFDRIGASFYGDGGDGGAGGTGGYTTNADISGGIGGNGGTGAATTVQFQGSFVADPANGYADEALLETSFGGNGGNGGDSSNMGIFLKSGGNAGNGGNGGSLSLGGSGSVQAFRQGVTVSSYGGAGGTGGNAGSADVLDDTDGGNGGNGGSGGSVSVRWTSGTITSTVIGILASSTGGSGGDGGAAENGPRTVGGDAGAGGAGGSASVLLGATAAVHVSQNAAYMTTGSGISALSNGGSGGAGGAAATTVGIYGGDGGNGGNGGAAAVSVLGTVTFAGINVPGTVAGQAVLVQSNGGSGGNGDATGVGEGHAGGGGFAGNGGSASLTLGEAGQASVIQTTGNYAHGALVQSIGGGGGTGGNAGFFGHGGDGAAGGNGGPVDIAAPDGSVLTRGSNSTALIAQSIGGGGGSGGDSTGLALGASLAVGGNGGLGGNGGPVTINLASQVFAASGTLGGGGVLAQSIGGAGGNGGSAIINGASFLALAIGGDSGGGGSGGNLTVGNQALVTTYGDHASGLEVQSIGGGGGKGGSAFSFNVGALPTAAVSVGGRGGGGGPAGSVSVTNKGQIATYGPDAPAVQLQSIGGGGGSGGAAVARAVALAPDKRIPAVSISVATGGSGGSGNTGGRVTLDNSGLITTAGDGAIGVIAQSIGGGGGSGGDSTAASYSGSREGGIAISVAVAVGGTGGSGGTGGDVGITNEGLVATLGQDAYGVFAQSIGGGGGIGGAGDATASSSDAKFSFTSSIGVGGKGGTGGDAGTVSLGNSGAITTRGDGSDGVFAQSIGGGGGAAGGGTATTSGGTLVLSVGVGGSGGAGGNGNSATIANSGSVITRGTDADAISVQSIGGGGGKAGKGGATAGGETTFSNAQALFDILSNGLGVSKDVQKFGDGILGVGETGEEIKATFDELGSIFPQPQAGEAEEGTAQEFDVGVSVGGTGGAAGHGALASVANTGAIATFGAESDGIFAQSIGGGGGDGGAATSTGSASDDGQVQSTIGVGGKGGGGGDGGAVVVTNGSGGSILTQGVTAFGVFAQSVGGGGGAGAMAGVVSGSLKSLNVGVGGNGGSVDVSTGGGTAGSPITTTGKHGIAIFAQSIGGGGGIARTITTDETFDPSKIINNPQGRLGDVQGLALSLGGQAGSSGDGGPVTVTTSGPITTSGLDAHAILAQSIGGGGGAVIGGQVTSVKGGSSSGHGDGGSVDLQLQPGTKIGTSGDGAYGILAQSIGGGGGIAGDPSGYGALAVGTQGLFMSSSGNGGMVAINATGASIATSGNDAPAILAQSLGGGGGLIDYGPAGSARTLALGDAHGAGDGNTVRISLTGARITASGTGSPGILAQSDGGTAAGQIVIVVDGNSSITVPAGPAISLLRGNDNQIDNAGLIQVDAGQDAIRANTPSGNNTIDNTGRIIGNIALAGGSGNLVDNQAGGVIEAAGLGLGGGLLRNAGVVQTAGTGAATMLDGSYHGLAGGVLEVAADFAHATSSPLVVGGNAVLDPGTVLRVDVASYQKGTLPALIVGGTLAGAFAPVAQAADPAYLFGVQAVPTGNGYAVRTSSEIAAAAAGLNSTRQGLAVGLQQIWDAGGGDPAGAAAQATAALATVRGPASYRASLTSLAGGSVGGVAAAKQAASERFTSNLINCEQAGGGGGLHEEEPCLWFRTTGTRTDLAGSDDNPGYRQDAVTLQIGGQAEVGPGWFVGASVGHEASWLSGSDDATDVSGETALFGLMLKRQTGPWVLTGVVDGGYGWYRSDRRVTVGSFAGTASASPNVAHAGIHLRAAYESALGAWYAKPYVTASAVYRGMAGYREVGSTPFDLDVQASSQVVGSVAPVFEIGRDTSIAGVGRLRGFVGVGVAGYIDNAWSSTARFAIAPSGSASFTATSRLPDAAALLQAGLDLFTIDTVEAKLTYDASLAPGYSSQALMGRLTYPF